MAKQLSNHFTAQIKLPTVNQGPTQRLRYAQLCPFVIHDGKFDTFLRLVSLELSVVDGPRSTEDALGGCAAGAGAATGAGAGADVGAGAGAA
jgi:hypothetical protein